MKIEENKIKNNARQTIPNCLSFPLLGSLNYSSLAYIEQNPEKETPTFWKFVVCGVF